MPAGRGLWSAFWALGADIDRTPWPGCGEIDVMEIVGAEPHRVFGTLHAPEHFRHTGVGGEHISHKPLPSDFRTYAVDWTPTEVTWSIDGTAYASVTAESLGASWVFDHPFYLLLNLAVGGSMGGTVGDETTFPAEMLINHVRVHALPR